MGTGILSSLGRSEVLVLRMRSECYGLCEGLCVCPLTNPTYGASVGPENSITY